MTKAKDLINWGELSRRLGLSRSSIRKNTFEKNTTKENVAIIEELLTVVDNVMAKVPDKAEKARDIKTNNLPEIQKE